MGLEAVDFKPQARSVNPRGQQERVPDRSVCLEYCLGAGEEAGPEGQNRVGRAGGRWAWSRPLKDEAQIQALGDEQIRRKDQKHVWKARSV